MDYLEVTRKSQLIRTLTTTPEGLGHQTICCEQKLVNTRFIPLFRRMGMSIGRLRGVVGDLIVIG